MTDLDDMFCIRQDDDTCNRHGGAFDANGACSSVRVLGDVLGERAHQFARYGTNSNLRDGTGPNVGWLAPCSYIDATLVQTRFREDYERREARHGAPTWMQLVREEVAEAFQESDPVRLREELVQVAALCVSWVETLDARAAE